MKLDLLKEMGVVRVKQVFIGLISMMGLLRIMSHNFEGVPLLRLPFEPFKMLRSVAHRGLKEEDALPAVAGYVRDLVGVGVLGRDEFFFEGGVGKKATAVAREGRARFFRISFCFFSR